MCSRWDCLWRCDHSGKTGGERCRPRVLTKCFSAVVEIHKRRSKKFYKTELTNIKIENQVMCKYRVDPQRARLTLIAHLTWSNLGLKRFKRSKDKM